MKYFKLLLVALVVVNFNCQAVSDGFKKQFPAGSKVALIPVHQNTAVSFGAAKAWNSTLPIEHLFSAGTSTWAVTAQNTMPFTDPGAYFTIGYTSNGKLTLSNKSLYLAKQNWGEAKTDWNREWAFYSGDTSSNSHWELEEVTLQNNFIKLFPYKARAVRIKHASSGMYLNSRYGHQQWQNFLSINFMNKRPQNYPEDIFTFLICDQKEMAKDKSALQKKAQEKQDKLAKERAAALSESETQAKEAAMLLISQMKS